MKNIINILVLLGICSLSLFANCTRNTNETVSCSDSKLVWQDNSEAKTVKKSWSEAIKYCEDLNFAGFSDWRLPGVRELYSILDYKRSNPIVNSAFVNSSFVYWSSTSHVDYQDSARPVYFLNGNPNLNSANKSHTYHVRCVRAGQ